MKARRGPNNPNWKGRKYTSKGYVLLSGHYDHPHANAKGEVREHVYIMSQSLGRPLYEHEEVHHKNGVKDDNRLENLELWSVGHQPKGQRVEDLVSWAKEILALYGGSENT